MISKRSSCYCCHGPYRRKANIIRTSCTRRASHYCKSTANGNGVCCISIAITLAEYKRNVCLTSLHGDAQIEHNLPFFPILEAYRLPGDHHL
jgi:hypothetical protein